MVYTVAMIFLDTETTGLEDARLVELCYWVEGAPSPVVLRCKPPKPIEIEASMVNGIVDKDVEMLLPFKDMPAYAEIKRTLEEGTVVAHNAPFDVAVLAREGIEIRNCVCTKKLAQSRWPEAKTHKLQYLRYWLPLEVESATAHSALGDVKALMALWSALHTDSADGTSTFNGEALTGATVTL